MIKIVHIPPSEMKGLKQQGKGKFIRIFLFFSLCFVALGAFFEVDFMVSLSCMVIVAGILGFTVWRNKPTDDADFQSGVKIRRRGKVIAARYFPGNIAVTGGRLTKFVSITLEPAVVYGGYPQHDTFTVVAGMGAMYYKPDYSLFSRYKSLEGKEVEVEYFPYSGIVLAFRERPRAPQEALQKYHPGAWPGIWFYLSSFSLLNDNAQKGRLLFHADIAEIRLLRAKAGQEFFTIRMEARAGKQSLDMPSYADGFDELEQWLFRKRYFRKKTYERAKENRQELSVLCFQQTQA